MIGDGVNRATQQPDSRDKPALLTAAQNVTVPGAHETRWNWFTLVPEEAIQMELVHEFDYYGTLKPPVVFGSRMFLEVTEGQVTGNRLNGRLLSGGGDWIVLGSDGWGQVDVRGQIGTDDGAFIYTHYTGLLELNDKVMTATTNGSGTDWADQYFRTTPRFETGDERYRWLTTSLFVAEGRLKEGGAVDYRVYRIT